ncbi:MAG: glycosyltransferase family 2 protein [Elusimicrobia bacterium]|nr:glycosyltransferase family 2 protein [Elusimicrobiota bacterium]
MAEIFSDFVHWLEICIVYYFLFLNGVYIFLSLVAFRDVYAHLLRTLYSNYEELSRSPLTPPISIVVPAHNEEVDIAITVNNLLHLDYMRYEVIVVNDGSNDNTLSVLENTFQLEPCQDKPAGGLATKPIRGVYKSRRHHQLLVVDKENGGKADALNVGLGFARNPYFCSIDADVIMEPDALQRVVQPILESPKRVIAVGGIVRVANGCRIEKGRIAEISLSQNILVIFQVIEYFRAFLCGRTGFSRFNALMIISGAFGVFEKDLVMAIGGYRRDTVGEDMDLVTQLHAHMRRTGDSNYQIRFIPDPVCWTEVPTSMSVLARQRRRWQKGLLEVLGKNGQMFFNPRYGAVGLFAYPFLYLFEGWGLILECLGYPLILARWLTGSIQTDFMLAFLAATFLCGTTLSLTGLLLGEMTPRRYPKTSQWTLLAFFALFENLGYRQFTSLLRMWGMADHLRGAGGWGRMERQGFFIKRSQRKEAHT